MNKPYSESCDQNKEHILNIIEPLFSTTEEVLEIGSGTGQHALYFSQNMPQLIWRTSDCAEYLVGINRWLDDSSLTNVMKPFELDVSRSAWPDFKVDAVFTANSIHIMHQEDVVNLFKGVASILQRGGKFIIYGPFNYNGIYTSPSNESFDTWLKNRDVLSGVKHFEDIKYLAEKNGLQLSSDIEMPANNRILYFVQSS